jgi:hypothetical protein
MTIFWVSVGLHFCGKGEYLDSRRPSNNRLHTDSALRTSVTGVQGLVGKGVPLTKARVLRSRIIENGYVGFWIGGRVGDHSADHNEPT